jgi:hypothetical protein
MRIEGDYHADGYAVVHELVSRDIARAFMGMIKGILPPGDVPMHDQESPILNRPAFELYSHVFLPMQSFLWGLTPAMEAIVGKKLAPTYDYFRIYREGDVCRVHRDRAACEHSLSLTLDYSDDVPWPLEVGKQGWDGPEDLVAETFGNEPMASIPMQVGDAVLYQGVGHRHGRTTPNPNVWSAHLFCHWVEVDGRFAGEAFDRKGVPAPVNFTFAETRA